ncbi:MAG: DMT family transporter [Pseudomonadota bacterium]|jgi:drug/metabolite transporter (DMT)-like permease|nr:DMT family transporter [Pseudomonadota bacterium]
MTETGIVAKIGVLPGTVQAGIWMSISAVTYVVSIAIGRYIAPDIEVFQIAFLRNAFAVLFMMPWLMKVGIGAMRTNQIGRHILRGFMSSANVTLLFAAVALIPIADMSAINFLQPVIGAAIAGLVLGEVVSRARWIAIIAGFAGALIMIRPGFAEFNIGIAFALGSGVAGALVSIMIKTLVRRDPPDTIAAWLFVTQTLILLIPTIIVWKNPTLEQWILFAVIGFMSVILQRTYNRGIQAADVSVAMPFNFTRLIWAALLGWIVFAEFPDIWTWVGGTVIFAASVWLTRQGQQKQ